MYYQNTVIYNLVLKDTSLKKIKKNAEVIEIAQNIGLQMTSNRIESLTLFQTF
jgi:hypothetical protein